MFQILFIENVFFGGYQVSKALSNLSKHKKSNSLTTIQTVKSQHYKDPYCLKALLLNQPISL